MACFWNKLIQNANKISGTMLHLSNTKNIEFTWFRYVNSIFDDVALSYIWIQQMFNIPK